MSNSIALTISRVLVVSGCLLAFAHRLPAQTNVSQPVIVQGDAMPSSYGAPPEFSRSRFSNLTNAYVLPPGVFYFGEIYEGDIFREGKPDHLFTQEVEVGLPYRFGIAAETTFESFNGGRGFSTASIEARYALADWNKIPLNPTLFVEYKSGVGPIRHDEGPPPPPGSGEEEEEGSQQIPNAYEMRLLLAQDFGDQIEWAMNFFFEKENTGDRGREWGFAQSATKPIFLPNERLKVGVEMQYQNFTVKDTRGDPLNRFIIGPTVSWKPSRNTRFDVSPLFGCTDDSPRLQVFAVFSWLLGGSEGQEAEAPTSTRNR
jgi:outer membrane putative beta-barrel porin/alpha-amylase